MVSGYFYVIDIHLFRLEMATRSLGLLLGRCIPSVKENASKFCISRLELDTNINMYFKKLSYVFAHDPNKVCKTGDIVLIEELPEKMSKLITHRVLEVVFPLGDITDPLTGKKLSRGQFRDYQEEIDRLYGKSDKSFDYEKAPPRGWQEGKKDFTDKATYVKYHDDGTHDPYAF